MSPRPRRAAAGTAAAFCICENQQQQWADRPTRSVVETPCVRLHSLRVSQRRSLHGHAGKQAILHCADRERDRQRGLGSGPIPVAASLLDNAVRVLPVRRGRDVVCPSRSIKKWSNTRVNCRDVMYHQDQSNILGNNRLHCFIKDRSMHKDSKSSNQYLREHKSHSCARPKFRAWCNMAHPPQPVHICVNISLPRKILASSTHLQARTIL